MASRESPSIDEAGAVAAHYLRRAVKLYSDVDHVEGRYRLTRWVESDILPARFVTVYQSPGLAMVTTSDLATFERMLKDLRPALDDVKLIAKLIAEAAPSRRSVVASKSAVGWLPRYADVWHEPKTIGGSLTFFVSDLARGRFERFSIDDSYRLEVTDLGPGKKVGRR